jgi:uridine kinase
VLASGAARVGVDGVDGAGKTTFAGELAARLEGFGRLGADDFLNPPAARYARGRASPLGFFLDSYDLAALRAAVLAAPGPVIVDGLFLHRDELRDLWDYSVFLDVPEALSVARCLARDGPLPAGVGDRYVGGQRIYLERCDPRSRATLVIDNSELSAPVPGRRRSA